MLDEQVAIVDVDPFQWRRLWEAIFPAGAMEIYPGAGGKGFIFVLHDQGRVLKAVHTVRGRLPIAQVDDARALAEELAREYEADQVLIAEKGALQRFWDQAQLQADPALDWDEYVMLVNRMRRETEGLVVHPPEPAVPISPEQVSALAKWLFPGEGYLTFAVFEGNQPWTSALLGFNRGRIVTISTLDALEPLGLQIQDWRRDYPQIAALTERKFYRPVVLGVYMDLPTFQQVVQAEDQGQALVQAVLAGRVIVDPCPEQLSTFLRS